MEWKLELNLSTKTTLTRGSEFLTDWTSWSQTWSTGSTMTTNRRTLIRRRRYLRWKRKYLLLQANQRLKQNREDLPLFAHLQELYLSVKEYGLILNQELNSIKHTQWQTRLNTLLRHGQLPREEDGAIEFWRLKDDLRNKFEHSQHWSDDMWKSKMAGGGGNKKRFQYCTDPSGGHSGRNPIHLALQDNVLIPNNFFEYIYHTEMCNQFTLHHKFRINSGRTKFKQGKTDGILTAVNPMNKEHRDPHELDLTNHVLHRTSKSGKCTKIRCTGSVYSLLNEKD